jgi:hypothetical protein
MGKSSDMPTQEQAAQKKHNNITMKTEKTVIFIRKKTYNIARLFIAILTINSTCYQRYSL